VYFNVSRSGIVMGFWGHRRPKHASQKILPQRLFRCIHEMCCGKNLEELRIASNHKEIPIKLFQFLTQKCGTQRLFRCVHEMCCGKNLE